MVMDHPWASRVVAKYRGKQVAMNFSLKVGDGVWFGKYKNKAGVIVGFDQDEKGNPVALVDPVPKGRKKTKAIQIFRFWRREVEQ
tara:strand:+ start:3644 stop:3898 length:255 start_codon:yes stop_codon:yes gene_type:complete